MGTEGDVNKETAVCSPTQRHMETVSTPPPSPQQQGLQKETEAVRQENYNIHMLHLRCQDIVPNGVNSRSQISVKLKGRMNHLLNLLQCVTLTGDE